MCHPLVLHNITVGVGASDPQSVNARMDLDALLHDQDGVLTRGQALRWLSRSTLQHRLGRHWQIALPGVYVASTGVLTDRQRLRAALLYGGTEAQLADATALAAYGVRYLPAERTIHLLLPATERRVNRDGVVVRRTHRLPAPRTVSGLPYSPPERALADFAARIGNERTAIAVLADAIQRRVASRGGVLEELSHVTGRGAGVANRTGRWLAAGAVSAPEADFLRLCNRSTVLPPPLINPLIELPSGRRVSPDALFADAGLVHETNGRSAHSADDRFDDMQARHGAMTSAGLTVLHSSPRQIRTEPLRVLAELENSYLRTAGQGMPAGIRILRAHAA